MNLRDLLPPLTRSLLFFDCETTGPRPEEDRIVEIGFVLFKPDGTERIWSSLVNPTIPIPHEATYGNAQRGYEGHGITDANVNGCRTCYANGLPEVSSAAHGLVEGHDFLPWPTFADLAASVARGFTSCDFGGFNVMRFDLPLLRAELKRCGITWSYEDARVLDGHRIWQLGETRTLGDAVESFLGRKHDGAHRTDADARASLEVVAAQLERFEGLPRDLDALQLRQFPPKPKDPNGIDPDGKIVWRGEVAVMNFGKNWKNKRLDELTHKDLRWIVDPSRTGISDAVRKICQEALLGKYPTKQMPLAENL